MAQNNTLYVYTEILTYRVLPRQQQAVLDGLLAQTNRWVCLQPGFLTASCYSSEDGTQVVHHVEWRTKQDWQNAQRSPEQQMSLARMNALGGTLLDTHVYTAPKITKGPMEGVFTLPWRDEDVTPHAGAPGESAVVILHGKQTNNAISIVGATSAPNAGPPLHVHTFEDEIWHVIDGEFEFQIDEKIVRAPAGATVFGPRNHPHTFRYVGESGLGRIMFLFTPAGMEGIFLELEEWTRTGKQPTREELAAQADRYGISLV